MDAEGDVTIRAATVGDHPAILALIAQLQDAERSIEPALPPGATIAPAYFAELMDACRAHAGAVFIAERASRVQGFASVLARVPREGADEPRVSYALLRDLVVDRDHRGRGTGQALLDAALAHARASGASELRVDALARNTAAHALYARAGFEPYLVTRRLRL
jgi:GNAT superfamily N-acetyltransferase